jgi:hypothetical protein
MTIHNIAEYQRAKAHLADLTAIMNVLTLTQAGLSKYKHYRSVQSILTTIYNEKSLLDLYIENYKIIVDTKGQEGL